MEYEKRFGEVDPNLSDYVTPNGMDLPGDNERHFDMPKKAAQMLRDRLAAEHRGPDTPVVSAGHELDAAVVEARVGNVTYVRFPGRLM